MINHLQLRQVFSWRHNGVTGDTDDQNPTKNTWGWLIPLWNTSGFVQFSWVQDFVHQQKIVGSWKTSGELIEMLSTGKWFIRFFWRMFVHHIDYLPSGKLTWQWNIPVFHRKYIFKGSIFHCYVSLPECNGNWVGDEARIQKALDQLCRHTCPKMRLVPVHRCVCEQQGRK